MNYATFFEGILREAYNKMLGEVNQLDRIEFKIDKIIQESKKWKRN